MLGISFSHISVNFIKFMFKIRIPEILESAFYTIYILWETLFEKENLKLKKNMLVIFE